MEEFQEFPKIARLSRGTVVTEKIDGTNAQVFVEEVDAPGGLLPMPAGAVASVRFVSHGVEKARVLRAGSRNRYITPTDDNFGFAAWVCAHAVDLAQLGPGRHYGEWWGSGIQRGYGLTGGEKRFSLFNVGRWRETPPPACCSIVPVLYEGDFDMARILGALTMLGAAGSVASPGFMKPEGIVVYHAASRTYFKKTLEKDSEPKSSSAAK